MAQMAREGPILSNKVLVAEISTHAIKTVPALVQSRYRVWMDMLR